MAYLLSHWRPFDYDNTDCDLYIIYPVYTDLLLLIRIL